MSRPAAAKLQNVPFARHTPCPEIVAVAKVAILACNVEAVALPIVAVPVIVDEETSKFAPVALMKLRDVIVPDVEVRVEIVPEVARKLVPVAEVKERLVIVPFVAVNVVTPSVPIVPFVAKRFVANKFVEVEFVLVVLPK